MNATERLPLTNAQQGILDCIINHITENGYPPTIRDIGKYCGIRSPNGVNCHLKALEKKGYITRNGMVARGIVLVESATVSVPRELLTRVYETITSTNKASASDIDQVKTLLGL